MTREFAGIAVASPEETGFCPDRLGRKTVDLMTANHIGARNIDLAVGPNYGFGFGYSVRKGMPGSPGQFAWGGAAGSHRRTIHPADRQVDGEGVPLTEVERHRTPRCTILAIA